MIRYFPLLLLSFCVSVSAVAQDASTIKKDSTEIGSNKRPHQDLLFVDLTWDYLFNLPADVKQKWYGRGISAGLVYDHPFNDEGTFSGAIGASIASHNYYLNAVVSRFDSAGTNYSEFKVVGDTILARGKISVNYVDVPIELRFRTKENDKGLRWKFALGGKVGYRINVHEKIINDKGIKIKTYDYPNVTEIRYGVTARAGYGAVMLSAYYSLSPFFDSANSFTDQNSFSIGLSIVPF
ncbi:MAG: outer membrane beta-barrel protein [Cryomorphaceae bacterium]